MPAKVRAPEYRVEQTGPSTYEVQVRWQRQTFFRRRWKWTEWRTVAQRSSPMALVEHPMVYSDLARAEENMRFMQGRVVGLVQQGFIQR